MKIKEKFMKCFKTLDLTILSQTDKLDDFRMFDFGCYMQTLLMCTGAVAFAPAAAQTAPRAAQDSSGALKGAQRSLGKPSGAQDSLGELRGAQWSSRKLREAQGSSSG